MTRKGPQRKRVLVVEDDVLLAEILCDVVADYDVDVVGPAPTVEKALMLIEDRNPDAALLDIRLDEATVFPVCESLAARNIPFAFVSGSLDERPRKFNDIPVLAKPFQRDGVLELLKALLKSGHAIRAYQASSTRRRP